jgi:hypothetical protein
LVWPDVAAHPSSPGRRIATGDGSKQIPQSERHRQVLSW